MTKPRRMLLALILGIFVLSVSLGFLFVEDATAGLQAKLFNWGVALTLNVAASLLVVGILWITQAFPGLFSRADAGVRRFFPDWVTGKPDYKAFRKKFEKADLVQICSASFYNTIIGAPWFTDELAKRIKKRRSIRILLLDPNGSEIARRLAEGRRDEGPDPKPLDERARDTGPIIQRGLKSGGCPVNGVGNHFRHFDYSLPGWLRLGDTAWIVFYLRSEGGYSPAFQVKGGSILFKSFEAHFLGVWDHAREVAPDPTIYELQSPEQESPRLS